MGVPPINRVGRIQRQIKRAFVVSGGQHLLTIDLLEHAYPRVTHYEPWHYVSVYRAATKFAVRVGGRRAFIIWGPKPELADQISAKSDRDKTEIIAKFRGISWRYGTSPYSRPLLARLVT